MDSIGLSRKNYHSPPESLYANTIVKFLSDMTNEITPTMESLTGLTEREILHKMLDRILDTNGKENEAIWTEFIPGLIGECAKRTTYRLRIDATKDVSYEELL